MDVSDLLDDLNDAQRDAVSAPLGSTLVLAGAGSGKTRVLTHRIAWLVRVCNATPFNIMSVTFTNKAAGEMRGRVEKMLDAPTTGMWIGTFHSIAHRFLRSHWADAKLPQAFQILDSEDQLRLVKRVMKSLEIDDSRFPPKQAQGFINKRKDEGERARHVGLTQNPFHDTFVTIYKAYEDACDRAGLVDFAELLLRTHETLRDNPVLLDHYRRRFSHILVDEFQDTNTIQYAWIRLMCGDNTDVFIVGDDDQSIYGWRGAKVENIQQVSKDLPHTKIIRLEQNYRSTQTILKAANSVIANNSGRMGKNLWTEGHDGDPIELFVAFNEQDEARFIVDRIQEHSTRGEARSDVAILYRSNAQSRVMEENLIQQGIPYRVYGGLRFFERAEIKDAMAYLRLLANPHDDTAFDRVINTPTRGIGNTTLDIIRVYAKDHQTTLWQAAEYCIEQGILTKRAATAVSGFFRLIKYLEEESKGLALHEQCKLTINQTGLRDHFAKDKSDKGQTRLDNLDELITACRNFEQSFDQEDNGPEPLSAFLSHAALEAGEAQADEWEDCVQLMTMHSAKGLEFPLVFIAGLEEGLFPHKMSMDDPDGLEEERRLCYVGITRAEQKLVMSYAEKRRMHGVDNYTRPSRFLGEIPSELVHEVRPKVQVSRPAFSHNAMSADTADFPYRLGQTVSHPKFGDGIVLNLEGHGPHARIQVNFGQHGAKWLVIQFANLAPL